MTQVPAEERLVPMLPSDVEIDGMQKAALLKVVQSHGLPVNDKMTAKELRPWARALVHGARKAIEHPPHEGEPAPADAEPAAGDAAPMVDVPLDTVAATNVDTVEFEPLPFSIEKIPSIQTWARIEAMAKYLFKSSLRPAALKNEWDVGLVLLAAYDLGIPSSFAMQKIHVQNGRMGMMGELMSALILRDGHSLRADVANDATVARVWGKRKDDDEWTWAEFNIQDAEHAGLVFRDGEGNVKARSKDGNALPWELYTADMLYWRALARLARRHFSDCLGGISYTPDELGWAIDVETGDELESGAEKPYGRAGEPEPTMTIGRMRSELANALAELPEDLQKSIKEDWAKRNFPKVTELSAAAIKVVRGWVEAAQEIERQRDSTDHIPDAEEVVEQTDGSEEAGSGSPDRDAPEPAPAPAEASADVESVRTDLAGEPEPGEPTTAADDGPEALYCAACAERITVVPIIHDSAIGPLPYHPDCAPM